ncbi:3-isopropylmalate dehydrogenase AMT6 [Pseudocercospora fuligena]|uniref:3-isopropylmalate dehydrogenase n=1 Tax=Pseudocercospora fuligena TaxID=685502 RepID=A0A8H6VDB3_9PEZI|nr:3-isopropylmalate dehydrogenase AMT6 [Pseudocercospora fuligena]
MVSKLLIVTFDGDYCGPEVMAEGLKVLAEVNRQHPEIEFDIRSYPLGGVWLHQVQHMQCLTAWDLYGQAISQEALDAALAADAVLVGSVGGPKWADVFPPVEWGLGTLRRSLDAFGNLRPVRFLDPSQVSLSAYRPEYVAGTDILIVRELTGGLYSGDREEPDESLSAASDVDAYRREEIERVTRLAGRMASMRDPPLPVTSLDKANVLAACGRLWRRVVTKVMENEFPNVTIRHMLIDSASMKLGLRPSGLNGIVLTSNMFGDIISDQASAIVGSIGMLPSASLCDVPDSTSSKLVRGLYEPIHGSAPDIAGKSMANPIGMILSVAMMCRYSLPLADSADAIEKAVKQTIEAGVRTADIGGSAATSDVGTSIVANLARLRDVK